MILKLFEQYGTRYIISPPQARELLTHAKQPKSTIETVVKILQQFWKEHTDYRFITDPVLWSDSATQIIKKLLERK